MGFTGGNRRRLYLIGYRGTGKTTVGRLLAARLGWTSVDADDEIERQAGKSIRDIFAESGEPTFRDWESRVLEQLAQFELPQTAGDSGIVVALGGGAVMRPENRAVIAASGRCIWLRAPADTIWARLCADASTDSRRPNLTPVGGKEEVLRLLTLREPIYAECADYVVDTDRRSPDAITRQILDWLSGQVDFGKAES